MPTPTSPLLFMHIPKAAGTSLNSVIENQVDHGQVFPPYYEAYHGDEAPGEPGAARGFSLMRGHFTYATACRLLGSAPTCLTMLREPVERFLSEHDYLASVQLAYPTQMSDLRRATPLESFLDDRDLLEASGSIDRQTHMVASDQPWGKLDYALDMDRARAQLDAFAFVGLTERFQESLFLLSYLMGWQPVIQAPRLNVTPRRPMREQLREDVLRRISDINARDAALYAHAERLFTQRYGEMARALWARHGCRVGIKEDEANDLAAVCRLLHEEYDQRFRESQQFTNSLHIDFQKALHASGWHEREPQADGSMRRWTGPDATASLDLPLSLDRDVQVELYVVGALAPDILDSLSLHVNGYRFPLDRRPHPDGGLVCSATVPRLVLASGRSYTRIAFEVQRTMTPAALDPTSTDSRRLGVCVAWINIEPT